MLARELEQVGEELGDSVRILKVDCDEEEDLAQQLQIRRAGTASRRAARNSHTVQVTHASQALRHAKYVAPLMQGPADIGVHQPRQNQASTAH